MTFEQWASQVVYREAMSEDEAGEYAGLPGRIYPAGYMVETAYGWLVPMPQEEREFRTANDDVSYAEPERFLWDAWCKGEMNGSDLDSLFEEVAKETAARNDAVMADPAYQAKRKRKRKREDAKHAAGIGVYTPEEIAAHEAEEAEEEADEEEAR